MTAFCSEQGITHHFTAPYTSAHNGRAERLHRTLFEKARTMRIACEQCEAPPSKWDEFCATAAFLTNLSATASLDGRTPYERWFNRVPSLSNLHEIGCLAFALVQSHNLKLHPAPSPAP
jgi:transposase InsO family protein